MFVVHRDQVEALAALRRRELEEEARVALAALLRREVTASSVAAGVARAVARGFATDALAWQYLAVETWLGDDLLVAWPWAAATLEDEELSALGKLRTLLRAARDRGHDVAVVDFVNERRS